MSVQNLKAQFSKNNTGAPLSSPGTSFLNAHRAHLRSSCAPPQNANLKFQNSIPSNVNNLTSKNVNVSVSNGNHVPNGGPPMGGSTSPTKTHIPVSKFTTRLSSDHLLNGNASPPEVPIVTPPKFRPSPDRTQVDSRTPDKWCALYEEAERKRKTLQLENQKVKRDYENLEKKFKQLQEQQRATQNELLRKDDQLTQLTKLSEGVYKEYDQLKHQYDMELGAMQKAMEKAHQWYKQNRELKRRSTMILERVMQFAPDSMETIGDETDNNDAEADEMAELHETIKGLRKDIAKLQTELNAAKLQEFEAQEQLTQLSVELEKERAARILAEEKLKERLEPESDNQLEILEEKLQLAESELECAVQRALAAEEQLEEMISERKKLEESGPPPPPPPPMMMAPPPPPLPPPPPPPGMSPLRIQNRMTHDQDLNATGDENAVQQMANLLGIPKKPAKPIQGVAIDDIINEIKGGKFCLRSTEKQTTPKKTEEPPAVVQEMRNILGTLRRRPRNSVVEKNYLK